MDASVVLWEHWHGQVKHFFEGVHGHQKTALALMVIGIILSGTAVLQRIAESVYLHGISQAKMPSIERRLWSSCVGIGADMICSASVRSIRCGVG